MDHNLTDPFVSHTRQPLQPPNANPIQHPTTNPVYPPLYQLPQPRKPSSTMNELDALRVRSIELETELRLLKAQLLQAQSGTQYLVNCFAAPQARGQLGPESENQRLRTEVHRLRGELRMQSRRSSTWGGGSPVPSGGGGARRVRAGRPDGSEERERRFEAMQIQLQEATNQRDALLNDVLRLLREDANEYSFRFDDGDPARFRPLEVFGEKVARLVGGEEDGTSLLEGDLLGDEDAVAQTKGRFDTPRERLTPEHRRQAFYVKAADVALLDLDAGEWKGGGDDGWGVEDHDHPAASPRVHEHAHPLRRHPPSPKYSYAPRRPRHHHQYQRHAGLASFMPVEHNWLMANATFIEEKDLDEYLDVWQDLENGVRFGGRHAKEEWKEYYEERVRPVFLRRMEGRAKADAGGEVRGGEQGDSEVKRAESVEVEEVLRPEEEVAARQDVDGAADVAAKIQEEHDDCAEEVLKIDGRAADDFTQESADADQQNKENDPLPPASEVVVQVKEVAETEDVIAIEEAVPTKKAVGFEESQWAEPEPKTNRFPGSVRYDAAGTRSKHAEEVSPKSQLARKQESAVTKPPIPAFGSSNPLAPPQGTSTAPSAPIPGLAGGWPKPAPRRHQQAPLGPRFHASASQKDPQTWNALFFSIQQKSANVFALGSNEKSLRTVIITGVPVGTKLVDILDKVRGGKIVGANPVDTAGMKTTPPITTNTILVEFLGSKQAKAFVEFCASHPLHLATSAQDEQAQISVDLIRTQTLRLPPKLQTDMLLPEGALTRILFLIFPDPSTAPVPDALARQISSFAASFGFHELPRHPLRITGEEDGLVEFEYADVRQAATAWQVVKLWQETGRWKKVEEGRVSKGFARDPCARALERGEVQREDEGRMRKGEEGQRDKGIEDWIEQTERESGVGEGVETRTEGAHEMMEA